MTHPRQVTVTQKINAHPAEVCRGFTHPTLLRDWLCYAASSEAYPGGHIFLHWRSGRSVTGTYEQLNPPDRLRISWIDTRIQAQTAVEILCKPEAVGTQLTLTHTVEGATESAETALDLQAFWEEALENLASVIETGIDLRLTRRPRLGIWMGEFTPEIAEQLGVPVKEGVLLDGTADGTGAQAAGLVKGDVLVSLNGVALKYPNSFESALVGLKAGDSPLVEFYRGADRHSVPLELGSFPLPDVPASAQELAEKVHELDARLMDALRTQLAGVSDEIASLHPAVGEWNAKELVAHFVLCERDFQGWAADMLNDTPVLDSFLMRPNVPARLAALVDRLGTIEALLDELSLAKAETEAMITAFPDHFTSQRKHLYNRAAQWELEVAPGHYFGEHQEQIQAALHPGEKTAG